MGDFSLFAKPNSKFVEVLITVLAPIFQFAVPETMPEYIGKDWMTVFESPLQDVI